jgi:hypothetical protein
MAVLAYNQILDIRTTLAAIFVSISGLVIEAFDNRTGYRICVQYPDRISVTLETKMAAKIRYPNSNLSGYQDFQDIGCPVIGV